MMDGRVGAMRAALDGEGFADTRHPLVRRQIRVVRSTAPSAKPPTARPSSAIAPATRWIPANAREALREAALDEEEGADMLMVKPALPYLDVIAKVRAATQPAARRVQRERRVRDDQGRRGGGDDRREARRSLEVLTSIRRAGRRLHPHLPCPRCSQAPRLSGIS